MKKPIYSDVDGDVSKFLPLVNKYVEFLESQAAHWHEAYAKSEQQNSLLKEALQAIEDSPDNSNFSITQSIKQALKALKE